MRTNMRVERVHQGLSLRQVGGMAGVSPITVQGWEKGATDPSGSNLICLSRLYGCTPEYLLGLTEDRDGRTGQQAFSVVCQRSRRSSVMPRSRSAEQP